METVLSGIIIMLAIIIIVLVRRNMLLSAGINDYIAGEQSSAAPSAASLSKFESLASELARLRENNLSNPHAFFNDILDCACMLLNSARGSVMLYDEISDELKIIAARNLEQHLVRTLRISPGEGIAGRAFKTGEIIYVTDPESNTQYVGFENFPDQKEPFISVPVKTAKRGYCVLNLHLTSGHARFTDYDLKLLTLLAAEAGLIIENNRLSLGK